MSQISLQDAARAIAVDHAGSFDEDPNVTQYMLRMADRIDELESQNDSLKHQIDVLETNINLKASFIDATIDDSAADHQTIQVAKTTLEDIAAGRGMFGLNDKEDLKWVMNLAGKTAEVIETRMKK